MDLYGADHLQRLSLSLDIMPWGILTVDTDDPALPVAFYNKRAAVMCGLQSADEKPNVKNVFLHLNLDDELMTHVHGTAVYTHDFENKKGDSPRWYRMTFIPCGGDRPFCILMIEDRTEQTIMEGQFFQAQRLESLGQLAGGVAHDFNNILSIIDGYARMASKMVHGNTQALDYIDKIKNAVQRGSSLTEKLLTFGRHRYLKDCVIDLGVLVKEQEPLLSSLLDASIALTMHCEEETYVKISPDNISQILLNLCINARDAMPDGGRLDICVCKTDNKKASLLVCDTGTGMPPDICAKIFDPFFTTKEPGKGTGLGLSMVYGLVQDMKGEISVDSKCGSGTGFSITLPLCDGRATIPDDDYGVDDFKLDGLTALIAEDEKDLLDLVSGIMEEMGATVLKACNGLEALKLEKEYDGNIDFLITDVVMPELNGVKLAEQFQQDRPDCKIMFMSGYPAKGQLARVTLPHNIPFLPKPVDCQKIARIIKVMKENDGDVIGEWTSLSGLWKNA